MTLGTKSILAVSVCAVLFGAACKKKADDAAGSGSATATGSASATGSGSASGTAAPAVDAAEAPPAVDAAEAAAATTPELKALDDTIAPILAMTDEAERTKTACKSLDNITTQIQAVRKAPPAGVDPLAWTSAAEGMSGALEEFGIECGEGSASNTKALSAAVEAEKEFQPLLAKKAP